MRIAVVGTGVAGNAAAWTLAHRYPVTVYERELRPGGHSNTVTVDYDGHSIAVDTGFIVYNERNYPLLTSLLDHLGVATIESCMSFSVSANRGAFEWKGGGTNWLETAQGLFAQPSNLLSISYLRMLRHILRFNETSVADFARGALSGLSLGDYFARRGYSTRLLRDYLAPMGAAIWSTPVHRMLDFPAENFVAFFTNHCLLQYDRPTWRTVLGGSRRYVEKMAASFRDLRLGCAVTSITRTSQGVIIEDSHGHADTFDHVILGTHTDQALAVLSDASDAERSILGAIRYAPNVAYLHRDDRLMPRRPSAWASWNFLRWPREDAAVNDVAVTYWMNKLQGIDQNRPLFLSLNPPFAPDAAKTFGRYIYDHPQYDAAAFRAQRQLKEIQGQRHTWFCGAWTGYGFHEDGLRSGLAIAESLGVAAPWSAAMGELSQAAE